MNSQAVEIEILGKITRVNCPVGQEDALRQAALNLNQRIEDMAQKTKVANTEKLITIAALNICYELLEKEATSEIQQDIEQRLEFLDDKLDKALTKE
ncbi:Z-ring-associated protein [Vibrio sp. UCD-FRSSP16_10]|uniref:cell division protein ZapA n=1 Tax=unclassified Vibrio TaxID=2614977 RepID=UPI0007FDB882|nr:MULTISPECIES: cell division protein ZapA [unclassified Vibrio]OBT17355.1 Z-ring-associated protein [Vibrio sp. UCD-FRSSP16_30]OBT23124.1 Z-ring-associated protein [Vibrio sp. UCD-FRSSP16_10]